MHGFSLETYLKDIKELVSIDSPPYHPSGTGKVADFFQCKYRDAGFNVERVHFSDEVGPLLKVTNGGFKEYDILFLGHMDTVFPVGTADKRPFYISDGRAYGPGIGDMKGGLLSLFYVLVSLKEEGLLDDMNICVVQNSDHEGVGSKFSRPVLESLGRRSRYCLVLEAARASGAVVSERRGINRYIISFQGVASHTGNNPDGGSNAIHEMAHWIMELQKLTNNDLETTVNVTMASGGISPNVIPPVAELTIDCRFMEINEIERINKRIEELKNRSFIDGVVTSYEQKNFRPPLKLSEETKELCARIVEIAKEKIDINLEWIKAGGASDGNYVAAIGTPTLDGLGAISGEPHSEGEYLLIESVEPRMRLLKEIILLLGK